MTLYNINDYLQRLSKMRSLVFLLLGITAILFIKQFAEIYTTIFEHPKLSNSYIQTSDNVVTASLIDQWHLFGKSSDPLITPSMLNVKLSGVVANHDQQNSYALIVDSHGVEKVYRIGQQIDGAVITKILPNHIILNAAGHLQDLKLPEKEQG